MRRIAAPLVWLGALALLHVVSLLPAPFVQADPVAVLARPSPDLAALLALAVLGAAVGRPRWCAHAAALLLLACALHVSATFYVRLLLDRKLDLTFDVLQLPGLVHLLTQDTEMPQAVAVGGAVLALLLAELVLAWAFTRVARPVRTRVGAVWLVAGLQLLVLADVARASFDRRAEPWWHASALVPLADALGRAVPYWLDPEGFDRPLRERIAAAAEVMASAPIDLGRLERADVHLVFVESYGRFAHRSPVVAAALRRLWRETAPDLRAAGVEVCTAMCRPSNTGGGSSLAHAQLLSGVLVNHPRVMTLLLESELQPLPRRFQAAGYHTVAVMPAMYRPWPQGQRFYGFDEFLTQAELGYRGTPYHWGRMPDQFALHHLLRRVVEPAEDPLFTMYVSVTSHEPFSRIPPYEPDWCLDAQTFARPPRVVHPVGFLDLPDGPALVPAYADAIEYALRCAIDFTTRLPRASLVIVVGDHQPPLIGVHDDPEMAFDVPIHVFANRPGLLAPLRAIGFVDGYEVPENAGVFTTSVLAPTMLRLYSQ